MYLLLVLMMICRGCDKEKHEEDFPMRKDYPKTSRRPYCHLCVADISRARYKSHQRNQPFKLKASRAASKASSNKVPCDVDAEYLESIWTDVCPIFGDKLDVSAPRGEEGCVELDRFVPDLGYVKGNVTLPNLEIAERSQVFLEGREGQGKPYRLCEHFPVLVSRF